MHGPRLHLAERNRRSLARAQEHGRAVVWSKTCRSWLFASSLFFSVASPSFGQETPPTFAQKVSELLAISTKAEKLASDLQTSLTSSQENVTQLSQTLAETESELTYLQADLLAQQIKAELSASESAKLKNLGRTLQDSLDKSAKDFETYKLAAEARQWWGIAGAGAAGLLVGACAAFLTNR
jgi:hypothetical protein